MTESNTNTALEKFTPTDTAIAAMRDEYMPLAIRDVNDAKGFKAVHSARMVVKNHRVEVEKVRKELKAEALAYGRRVDGEAKRIVAMLKPIEDHLAQEEATHEAEKERIRNADRLKAEAEAKAKADAEAARIEAEKEADAARIKKAQDAEDARLRAEADKLAEQKRIIDEQRREIEAEKKRLADIEAARLREIELEKAKKEAAERARIETEQRIAHEAEAAKSKAEAEEAARNRAEALRPDCEKILSVAGAVLAIEIPELSDAAGTAATQISSVLVDAESKIHSIANNL